ncbi:MAG: 2'-5' RNA ligase family protein [Pseudonocardiaceae bacterium]
MTETTQQMRDHWWWRPGWRVGRSFYTWHVTFDDQPAAHQLAADYTPVLDDLPTVDPIPVQWLHLTMQGVGFTDETDRADVDAIVAAAQHRCAALTPFTITLGPARVDPEALMLPVRPPEPVAALRTAIRAAIADVWGPDTVPEDPHDFRPHVSLAYSNHTGPAEPITQRLAAHPLTSTEITIHRASLIELNRDHRAYEWTDIATAELSTPRTSPHPPDRPC